ncbi:xanthine dehydrogenase family protein molybdopterin-binding subunit [Acuticoccus sp. M5D2P5]|uniref:xanthine dehydrogenase family protein molybdopterin-binding subunit n=1 Tax=Acuticoccus kalidii TaxID=2910977 RepID=UPI001F46B1F7|nr:xanthine dehydrogenase family protein molybdopterin-binding subunit [Acuticoccus kalidii]MCF3934198.1 xanthine dehydrogenase family protein molybdopterin-binding subunit [Acuticoccus kalidii]
MKHSGRSLSRIEDRALVTGRGRFVADFAFPRQLHMRIVRSPVAFGRLKDVDTSSAFDVAGVVAVWTAADIAAIPPIPVRGPAPAAIASFLQPILARDLVRYVGEPVAAVFAESAAAADDAAERVALDIAPLEPTLDPAGPIPNVMDAARSNEAATVRKAFGDLGSAFQSAAHVVAIEVDLARDGAVPAETRSLLAQWDPARDIVDLWAPARSAPHHRDTLAAMLGLPRAGIAVHVPNLGGGSGAHGEIDPEDVLVTHAARVLARPVAWVEDRREHLHAAAQTRGMTAKARAAVGPDGTLLGLDVDVMIDAGAYVRAEGMMVAEFLTAMLPGPYRFKAFRGTAHVRMTNRTPAGSFRAAGRAEATFVRERLLDAVTAALGADPFEIRTRNLLAPEDLPHDRHLAALGRPIVYDSGRYQHLVDQTMKHFSLELLRQRTDDRRAKGELVGLGCAAFVDVAGMGEAAHVRLSVDRIGIVEIVTAASDLGEGMPTTIAQVVADIVGVDYDTVRVRTGETDRIHTVSSPVPPSAELVITAAQYAAEAARELILDAAQALLDDTGDRLTIQSGRIREADRHFGVALSLGDIAAALEPGGLLSDRGGRGLVTEGSAKADGLSFPYGVHIVLAEIDKQTGMVRIPRAFVAYDVGNAVNPALVESQLASGALEGIAGALYTALDVSGLGDPRAINYADYPVPTACELPDIEVLVSEAAPTPLNPLGIKGAMDGGFTGIGAAIASAVDAALSAPGFVTHLPISPARIMAQIRARETA